MTGAVGQSKFASILLGLALVAAGTVAVIFPYVATFSAKIFIGAFLLVSGVIQIVHAFAAGGVAKVAWEAAVGGLEALAGLFLLLYPVAGVMALTLYLAGVFVAGGVMRVLFALRQKPEAGWAWILAGGLVTVALGIMLLARFPSSAFWAIGLLLGLNIAMYGFMLLAMAVDPNVSNQLRAKPS